MGWDPVACLDLALGADLLRCELLGASRPTLGDRYAIRRVLGHGATGIVVSAHDGRLGRDVALKLRVAGADATILEEARALARLDHPNVVRVYDVEVASAVLNGIPFRLWLVSMQLVAGRSLRAWGREASWPADEIARVFLDAGQGLAAAHREKIIHRDFKPDNVMVRDDGVAMVLDFGFAIAAVSTLLGEGGPPRGVAGTDPYMAPEARRGQACRRSDQFSFGVSLVEALTGEARAAGSRPPEVPAGLWSVAARATAERASDRFSDMSALLAALKVALAATGGRRRRVVGAGVLGALAALGAVVVALAASRTTTGHRDVPPASAAGSDGGPWRGGEPGGAVASSNLRPEGVDAGAPDPPKDVGTSRASDAGGDARLQGPAGLAAAEDAARVAAPDAGGPHCPSVAGTYYFQTIRRRGGRMGDASSARYELVLVEQRRGMTASLARTRPRVDHLEVTLVRRAPDCALWIVAAAESRRYDFWLRVSGGAVSGDFKAVGDPARPDFSGDVESSGP